MFLVYYFGSQYTAKQKTVGTIYYKISTLVPYEVKQFLKKTVFIVSSLKRENKDLTKSTDFFRYKAYSIESKYYLTLEHESKKLQNKNINSITLKKFLTRSMSLDKKKLNFDYFQVSSLSNPKHSSAISTSYLSDFEDLLKS